MQYSSIGLLLLQNWHLEKILSFWDFSQEKIKGSHVELIFNCDIVTITVFIDILILTDGKMLAAR